MSTFGNAPLHPFYRLSADDETSYHSELALISPGINSPDPWHYLFLKAEPLADIL